MERIVTLGAKLSEFQNAHHSLNDYRRLRTPSAGAGVRIALALEEV